MDKTDSLAKTIYDRVAAVTIENQSLRRQVRIARAAAQRGLREANAQGAVAWREALEDVVASTAPAAVRPER